MNASIEAIKQRLANSTKLSSEEIDSFIQNLEKLETFSKFLKDKLNIRDEDFDSFFKITLRKILVENEDKIKSEDDIIIFAGISLEHLAVEHEFDKIDPKELNIALVNVMRMGEALI